METGMLGMLAFVWLIYLLFKLSLSMWYACTDAFAWSPAAGFASGLVGLLVHAVGANTFIVVRIMEPFRTLATIVFVPVDREEADQTRKP